MEKYGKFLIPLLESERIKSRRVRSWKDVEAKEEGTQGGGMGNKTAGGNKYK